MNDRLTVEWLRSANCRSRCQTLQTYMRTVVVHIAGNGLKCINMCITKRALHYLWEWIRARARWCHRSCDALAGIALRCRCRWTMATINVHIMHDLHLQPRLSAKRERINKKKNTSDTDNRCSAHLHNGKSSVHSHNAENNRVWFNNKKKKACSILRVHLEAFILR